jgi:hypothetical protein
MVKTEVGAQNEGFKNSFSKYMAENNFFARNRFFSGSITPVKLMKFS